MTTIKVWSWRQAVQKSALQPMTKLVLYNLAIHMNDLGQGCFPSTRQQAEDTGMTERSVCTHLQKAEEAGFIRKSRHGFSGNGWARNEYIAALPAGVEVGHARPSTKPMKSLKTAPKATEPVSAPNLDSGAKGTEPRSARNSDNRAQGTEPDDKKALNHVQSNSSIELSKKKTAPKGAAATAKGKPKPKLTPEEQATAYEGHVIRLNNADWKAFLAEYQVDDDDLTELIKERDEWIRKLPPDDGRRKRWWIPTKNWLKKQTERSSAA